MLEMLNNFNDDDYLYKLIDFIIFFIEEGFFIKYNYDIFIKTVEFIVFKLHEVILDNYHSSTIHQTLRLVKVFVMKTSDHIALLSANQIEQFHLFNYKIFNLLISTYFFNLKDKSALNEENMITLVGYLKAIMNTDFIDKQHTNFNALNFSRFCLKLALTNGIKVKERIFGLIIQIINKYNKFIRDEELRVLPYKLLLVFIVSYSTHDAIYALSSLQVNCLYDILYIETDIKTTKYDQLKSFYEEIIKKSVSNTFDVHKFFNQKAKKEDLNEFISFLLVHVHEKLTKIEINFLLQLLNSKYIDNTKKLELFDKIFICKTKDVQDLFDGLYRYIKGDKTNLLYTNSAFLLKFIWFMYSHLNTKSVNKTILKSLFLLFKIAIDHGFMLQEERTGFMYDLLDCMESRISIYDLVDNYRYKSNAIENIEQTAKHKGKHLDNAKNTNETHVLKIEDKDVVNHDLTTNCNNVQLIIARVYDRIKEINEIKTHGLFFLLMIDLYEHEARVLNLSTKNLIDKKIVNEYLEKISNNIVLDSFLLKSPLISPNIFESIQNPHIIEILYNYLLSKTSKLNIKNVQEFSNNYIKNRHEISKFIFEIKSIFIHYLLNQQDCSVYLQKYMIDLGIYLSELHDFLRLSCECVFIDFEEATAKAIKRDKVCVKACNYKGLDDTMEILDKGKLTS